MRVPQHHVANVRLFGTVYFVPSITGTTAIASHLPRQEQEHQVYVVDDEDDVTWLDADDVEDVVLGPVLLFLNFAAVGRGAVVLVFVPVVVLDNESLVDALVYR
mmetsp:Transcript_27546/g.40492  ORF Transcript_27546/g.40492 Transcript_27546/m.40492 type:complete len:104 (+) Transcript_27546:58-369(+)